MQAIHVKLQKVGNSRGVLLPKPLLAQAGLSDATGVDMVLDGDAIVLRKPAHTTRAGWAQAAAQVAQAGDDALLLGDFGNATDEDWQW